MISKSVGAFPRILAAPAAGMRGTAGAAQILDFALNGRKCSKSFCVLQNDGCELQGAPQEGRTEALFREREGVYPGGRLFQSILSVSSVPHFQLVRILLC